MVDVHERPQSMKNVNELALECKGNGTTTTSDVLASHSRICHDCVIFVPVLVRDQVQRTPREVSMDSPPAFVRDVRGRRNSLRVPDAVGFPRVGPRERIERGQHAHAGHRVSEPGDHRRRLISHVGDTPAVIAYDSSRR